VVPTPPGLGRIPSGQGGKNFLLKGEAQWEGGSSSELPKKREWPAPTGPLESHLTGLKKWTGGRGSAGADHMDVRERTRKGKALPKRN